MIAMHQLKKLVDTLPAAKEKGTVDVAINVYGKPYNTVATLYSLLKHSGQWIDKIYFITERKQPYNCSLELVREAFGNRLTCFTPGLWLWVRPFHTRWLYRVNFFRKAVRYQYAWEQTDKDFLFITHNDVLYSNDIIGAMLPVVEGHIATGQVGQCWNCSAHFAGACTPDTYTTYKPSYPELQQLLSAYPGSRAKDYQKGVPDKKHPWPLPECRLNEWTALINMKLARQVTMPHGKAVPFGAFHGLDIGTQWFHDVLNMGFTIPHFSLEPYARHAWAGSTANGHSALFDKAEYDFSETNAANWLLQLLQTD